MTCDAVMMNALVEQNTQLVDLIHRAVDADALDNVNRLLEFAAPVWEAAGYGYKIKEVRNRIKSRANHLIATERAYLAGCRKNDRTRVSTQKEIERLESLELLVQ